MGLRLCYAEGSISLNPYNMHIQLEQTCQQAIQSYSDREIRVNSVTYRASFIIGQEQIITKWPIHSIKELSKAYLEPILALQPEIIILGHLETGAFPEIEIFEYLSRVKIGFECMNIGAASRTFNVLLSEGRKVAAGFILS